MAYGEWLIANGTSRLWRLRRHRSKNNIVAVPLANSGQARQVRLLEE